MKLGNVGIAVMGGLVALSLSGCAAAHALVGDGMDEVWDTGEGAGSTSQAATVDAQLVESTLTAEEEAAAPMDLQIVDSGWFVADNGMVDFALGVQNPNHTVEATSAIIEVVGKDDAGNVIFDETIETPGVLPDSVYYYSYVAGSTAASSATSNEMVKPASVEFSVSTPDGAWVATDQTLAEVYTIQDNGASDTDFGAKEFTGTVTASKALDGATQSRIDVVLLDNEGHIEGGYFTIVDTTAAQSADYEIYAVGAPDFASYAVYASPWSTDTGDASDAAGSDETVEVSEIAE